MKNKEIQYIEVDEQNGMLKVPNELAGQVAVLLKNKLGIEIKETFQKKERNSTCYVQEMQYIGTFLINKFLKYCQSRDNLITITQFLQNQKHKSNKRFYWKDLYYLINFSDIRNSFRKEWDWFLRNGEAEKTLSSNQVKENIRNSSSKWISLMIFENQKNTPYRDVFTMRVQKLQ